MVNVGGFTANIKSGLSTLELIIAFAILSLSLTAIVLVVWGNQSVGIDIETNTEAIQKGEKLLEDTRAQAHSNFASVVSTTSSEISGSLTYTKTLAVEDVTACKKQATSTVSWSTSPIRSQKVEFVSYLTDLAGALALGSDCPVSGPSSKWDNPQRFASDTFNPGKPYALDVLNRIAYLGVDRSPYLYIASTTYAVLGGTDGLIIGDSGTPYANSFALTDEVYALDAVRDQATGKTYVYAAMASTTKQLSVIDVTDMYNPTLVTTRSLSSCVSGSYPQGWRITYYGNKLYLLTRYTAGPELHIFDVSTFTNPLEYGSGSCKGFELGDTAEGIAAKDQVIGGVTRRFIYLPTDEIDKELRVFDVTNPLSISEVLAANQNLSGAQDGASVYIVGNKLYLGRQSASGADLFVYDISNPTLGLPLLGSKDIGTGVLAIRVAGKFAFLATPKTNKEFQVWNIKDPANITLIKEYNFGNVADQGIDYEPDFIYATGQATPNFQILYSP